MEEKTTAKKENREISNLFAELNYAFVLDEMKKNKKCFSILNSDEGQFREEFDFFSLQNIRNFQISVGENFNLPKCTMLICLAYCKQCYLKFMSSAR
jgi:hypothetical protein